MEKSFMQLTVDKEKSNDVFTSGQILHYRGFKGDIKVCFYRNVLFGHVQEIYDVIMYKGKTPKELLTSFEEVVDNYLKY